MRTFFMFGKWFWAMVGVLCIAFVSCLGAAQAFAGDTPSSRLGGDNSLQAETISLSEHLSESSTLDDEPANSLDGAEQFVQRLYLLVLQRQPDQEGFDVQCAAIRSGTTGAEIARNFFISPEFSDSGFTATQQVTIAYQAMLNRNPDEEGLSGWVDAMNCGMTIEGIAAGFAQSAEFNALCKTWGIVAGYVTPRQACDINFQVTRFVYRLYALTLNREPDCIGLNNWCALYLSGASCYNLAIGFLCSDEFALRGLPILSQVTIGYQAMLDRNPEPQGRSDWSHRIRNGLSMGEFVSGLCSSPEFNALCANRGLLSGAEQAGSVDCRSYDGYGPTDYVVTVDGAALCSSYINRVPYLFLPSSTNLSEVTLSYGSYFENHYLYVSANSDSGYQMLADGDSLNIDTMGLKADENGAWVIYVKDELDDSQTATLRIMKSSNIKTVYLTSKTASQGRAYVESSYDHTLQANVVTRVVDADGSVVYQDASGSYSTIKGRGNGTWTNKAKKPYQIKLSSKASLVTGDKANAAKKWNLLANAYDGSMMRDYIAQKIALAAGLSDTPDCCYADLYYDGEYRGTYLISEKVEVNAGRVDINDLDDENTSADGSDLNSHSVAAATNKYGYEYHYVTGVVNPSDITGGYLLERDNYYASETCWFDSSIGQIVVKTPEYASREEMCYISEYFQTALNEAGGNSGNIEAYFDLDSLANVFLVESIARNIDYIWWSSTYFYKDAGDSKIYSGPVWDFDLAFGVENDDHWKATEWWPADEYYFYWENRTFRALAKQKFQSKFSSIVGNFLDLNNVSEGSFIATQNMITDSARMNYMVWDSRPTGSIFESSCIFGTWAENVAYLHSWMSQRYAWLNGQFSSSSW